MSSKHFHSITTTFADPDAFEDATEVHGASEYDVGDDDECTGECLVTQVFVGDCGTVRCVYCGRKT